MPQRRKPKQPAPTYYTPPPIITEIQSARAQDAISTPSKRLEILLINPPLSARKRRRRTRKTTQTKPTKTKKEEK
jgi:hypothetical protein